MSLDDTLRDLMVERSGGRAVPTGHLDLIHRRLGRRRNRRLGAAAVAAAVACAAVAGVAIARPQQTPTGGPPAQATASPTAGLTLPDRLGRQALVVQKAEPLSPGHGEFSLVFVPRQWSFSVVMSCATPQDSNYQIEILINGSRRPYAVARCNEKLGQPEPGAEDENRRWWQNVHVMVGADTPVDVNEPMSITVRVGAPQHVRDERVGGVIIRSGPFELASGRAVVGVYQPVS